MEDELKIYEWKIEEWKMNGRGEKKLSLYKENIPQF